MGLVDRRPSGLVKHLFRAPVLLYRLGLGRVLGHRFAYLAHTGRRSGLRRDVVVEVARYSPDVPEVVVVAGWGDRSDWYRNLRAAPALELRVGERTWIGPDHRYLPVEEVAEVLRSYRRDHPRAWRRLARVLGVPADGGGDDAARSLPAIAFTPR
ncbi:nitroreductase family deazaflavin-dependent oxidoreductase [Umezawaea sp.]|uniref:nitroreductase family deazaflavin-dependent oxidoreductase n=1 Tax=Umezawaea sp. TaxID=1955258 RepID=UPI002ED3FC97